MTRSINSAFQGASHLIHAHHHHNLLRSKNHRRHTVAVAINIYQLAILANSIAAHQISVAQQGIAHQLLLFLRSFGNFPIDNRVALFDNIQKAHFFNGNAAAPSYHIGLGNQLQGLGYCLLLGGAIICSHAALFQILH